MRRAPHQMPGALSIVIALVSSALCLGDSPVRTDTARLAAHLQRFRHYRLYQMSAADYQPIRREFLAWLDSRMKKGISLKLMNEELEAANLLSDTSQSGDEIDDKTCAGFLGGVNTETVSGAQDLIAVNLGVHTGGNCYFDETIALYSRKSLQRVGQLNAERSYSHGFRLRAMAIGNVDPVHGRLIASAWVASNCTSNWNGNIFRIDASHDRAMGNVLNEGMAVFGGEDITVGVENDTVTFNYTTASGDDYLTRPGIARYRVQNGHPIRLAPIAASLEGFINEWLTMNDSEAARWSTSQASVHHNELAARFQKDVIVLQQAASCPGTPPTREVAVQGGESKQVTVFRITASSLPEMRIVAVSDSLSPGCQKIAEPAH